MDALGDKLIMGLKIIKPKSKSLVRTTFKELFKEELKPKTQTIEEQIRNMRNWK